MKCTGNHVASFLTVTAILSLCFSCTSSSDSTAVQTISSQPSPQSELAASILKKSGDKYATISSYQDSGIVETSGGSNKGKKQIQFKTYFVRPDMFRFEWIDSSTGRPMTNIVWYNGSETFSYQESSWQKLEKGRGLGLTAATANSEGAAQSIPRLLLGFNGSALTELVELVLEREEQVDGEPCYVIRGSQQVPEVTYDPYPKVKKVGKYELAKVELWISKSDSMIRKLRTSISDTSVVQEENHRDIKINETIPDSIFDFHRFVTDHH